MAAGSAFNPVALHEHVGQEIMRMIYVGELQPGQRIDPQVVAEALDVSHIPVRESLQGLAGQGRVVWKPRRGFFVPELDVEALEGVFHWLSVIEAESYRLTVPVLDDDDLERMQVLCGQLEQCIADGDLLAYRRIHRQFHFVPLDKPPTDLARRFLEYLWDEAERYATPALGEDLEIEGLQNQHRLLADAFRDRDLDSVLDIMKKHRHVSLASAVEHLRGD